MAMEEMAGGEVGSGGKHLDVESVVRTDGSLASSKPIADPVVYKLVRYIEDMLKKVKEEERLRLLHGVSDDAPKFASSVAISSDHCERLPVGDASSLPSSIVMATLPSLPPSSIENLKNHTEACVQPKIEKVVNGNFVSNGSEGTKSEVSSAKGDICLDNLSIRELQQTFRATFGRDTSVKDKLWLKRRIAMGLSNSCDVSATGFIIDKSLLFCDELNVVANDDKIDDTQLRDNVLKEESCKMPVALDSENEGRLAGPEKKSTAEKNENYSSEDPQMEQRGAKRLRKPTKRYIEELSEADTKESNEKSSSTGKKCAHRYPSQKSRSTVVCSTGSAEASAIFTRQDSFGGSGVQVPYVSRLRRGRPRKNFMGLLAGVEASNNETALVPYLGRRQQGLEVTKLDPVKDLDEYPLTVPTAKGGTRRKHHRAWTLSEVMRLVEGVSRCGAGRWSEIKRLAFASCAYRTSVDLKDKWRNLLRASAQALTDRAVWSLPPGKAFYSKFC
ncbi:Telomere repeat-binding protein 5 [Nymphaea thermarum]|nr:Telomere repeat-binding protein 5 [Nymphaea thermarum]